MSWIVRKKMKFMRGNFIESVGLMVVLMNVFEKEVCCCWGEEEEDCGKVKKMKDDLF